MDNPQIQSPQNLAVPFSQEAEEAVIGAVLVNPAVFMTIVDFLKAEDFYFLRTGYIWQALTRLNERSEAVDYLTVIQELRDLGWLEEIGGPAYLTHLVNNTPTSVHAEVYGRLVERAAIRRRLLQTADEIRGLALNEELTIDAVTTESESRLFAVTERQLRREFVPMHEAMGEYWNRLDYLLTNQEASLGVPTGFRDLDELLNGLQKSDLVIFAGRPGMGKTSFILSVALNAARMGARIGIFTMEMGVDQIVQRLISMETGINSQKMRSGTLNQQEYSRFVEAAGRLSSLRIYIDDTPSLNPLQMRTKCRRLAHEHGVDLIMLDYIQLMNSGKAYENNRVQEVSYISRSLKELARELNVPIFSAAQLSRAVEQRQDKRPLLSDLRESGCLAGDTRIYLPDSGRYVPIRDLAGKTGFKVLSLNTDTMKLESSLVTNAFCTGVKPICKLTTRLGRTIRATGNHKFLTIDGWKRLDELSIGDHLALPVYAPDVKTSGYRLKPTERAINHYGMFCRDDIYVVRCQTVNRFMADAMYRVPTPRSLHISSPLSGDLPEDVAGWLPASGGPQRNSDVYWDSIVAIEPAGEIDVYDLTVPGNSNFVANNIIVHNSIEQDSDVVMFLYRDAIYNEATEFPNQADVIVAKHRNGPTGTISLYFEKSITKFMDAAARRVDLGER